MDYKHVSILALILLTIALFTPMNAAESSSKAVAADAVLSMNIAVHDHTPMEERSHAMNRCFATVTVRNISSKKIRYPRGFAEFNWSMEGKPLSGDYTKAIPEGLTLPKDFFTAYRPVAFSAFGTFITKYIPLRSLDAGIDAGQEEVFEVDLGRMFDLSLSQRYFLSGKLDYEVDGVPAELKIQRVELIPETDKK